MTKRLIHLPAGGVVIPTQAAQDLAEAVLAAQQIAGKYGANLKPSVLLLVAEITSMNGNTEEPENMFDDNLEHEQIDAEQAAEIMGCSARNVRDLATRGRIPGIKKSGRWFFNPEDVTVYRDFR